LRYGDRYERGWCRKATAGGAAGAELTVQQILERHAAARARAEPWHKIQTMTWTGHIESGPGGISKHPFADVPAAGGDTLRNPRRGQRSVRVFDGTVGWKQRPTSQGTFEVKEYGAEELALRGTPADSTVPARLEGQRNSIALEVRFGGGHRAYHLKLTLPPDRCRRLDRRGEFPGAALRPRHPQPVGATGIVSVYLRNYQTVNGLVMPLLIETGDRRAATPTR